MVSSDSKGTAGRVHRGDEVDSDRAGQQFCRGELVLPRILDGASWIPTVRVDLYLFPIYRL